MARIPAGTSPFRPVKAPVYLTDGERLVQVLESDRSGVLGEDVCTELLVSIEAAQICGAGESCEPPRWRTVTPAKEEP